MLNEQDNVAELVRQVAALREPGLDLELIVVDDGSTDETLARLCELAATHEWLVVLHRDRSAGQSAAMAAGIAAARGAYIATLDGDLQNDPADLADMLRTAREQRLDLVQGMRTRRQDSVVRKCSTWVGRTTRRLIMSDPTVDTGCATRVMTSELARSVPLHFRGMHRFIPAYAHLIGAKVIEVPVNHRPRIAGTSKYGMLNRAFVGLVDCMALRWMARRYRHVPAERVVGKDGRA